MSRWKRKKPKNSRLTIYGAPVIDTPTSVLYRLTDIGDKRVVVFVAPDASWDEVSEELRLLLGQLEEPSPDVIERLGLA